MCSAEARTIQVKRPTISHAELMTREFGPVIWGIDGLLPQGVSILAAKPKIGKSWLALQMCWAKAMGRELWDGRSAESKGAALYIALEDNLRRLQKRSDRQFPQYMHRGESGTRWQADALENLHYATDWPRIGKGGIRQLERWLVDHPDCELVVIDTLARIRAERSSNNPYDEDYKVGERLKVVADKHNIAILLIHHTRKMDAEDPFDTISGSQGLTGSVDASLVLTRLRGATEAGLFVTGRDIENEVELAIQFDKNECRWMSTGISVQEAKLDESRRVILDAIRLAQKASKDNDFDGLTIKQIRARLADDGISKSADAVARTVGRMVKETQVQKINGNKYRVFVSELSDYA